MFSIYFVHRSLIGRLTVCLESLVGSRNSSASFLEVSWLLRLVIPLRAHGHLVNAKEVWAYLVSDLLPALHKQQASGRNRVQLTRLAMKVASSLVPLMDINSLKQGVHAILSMESLFPKKLSDAFETIEFFSLALCRVRLTYNQDSKEDRFLSWLLDALYYGEVLEPLSIVIGLVFLAISYPTLESAQNTDLFPDLSQVSSPKVHASVLTTPDTVICTKLQERLENILKDRKRDLSIEGAHNVVSFALIVGWSVRINRYTHPFHTTFTLSH